MSCGTRRWPSSGCGEPVDELSARDHSAADAGADRDVDERVEASGRAEAVLAERRRVHVRVERHRDAEARPEWLRDVGVRPSGLGRCRDPARFQVDRAEATDPERLDRAFMLEERRSAVERFRRRRGWDRLRRAQGVRARADGELALRPAGFDASDYLPATLEDVGRDRVDLRLRQLSLERRHDALAVRDSVDHERLRRLRVVQVGADRAGRAGVLERVTAGAARLLEDLLAHRKRAAAASGSGRRLLGRGRRRGRGRRGGRGHARRRADGARRRRPTPRMPRRPARPGR